MTQRNASRLRLPVLALAAITLAACNGDEDGAFSADPGSAGDSEGRGTLIEDPPALLGTYSATDLLAAISGSEVAEELLDLEYSPVCAIEVLRLRYRTIGALEEPTTASAALMVPSGEDPVCQGARPIVLYAHGTKVSRDYDIAALDDPTNTEGLLIAAVFASQGYVVVAPNYTGLAGSDLDYHPYLIADAQAADAIDALQAARSALPVSAAPEVSAGEELFLTGYSQGGYVALAALRELQEAGAAVTATAAMSGPYALTAFGDAIFQGRVPLTAPLNVALLTTSYQRAYGDVYESPTAAFAASYASGIESLLPADLADAGELYAQGSLPRQALFSGTPPAPEYAPLTPATTPEEFASVFARGFGPDHLLTNAYRQAYLQDVAINPDGGFPDTTDGLPPASPAHPFRQALVRNDLRNFLPESPVLLCGGSGDPTVFFFNTQLLQGYWAEQGATAPVTVLDVDAPAGESDPYARLRQNFDLAKAIVAAEGVVGGADDGGISAVREAYHATLVPPFCLSAVESFFEEF